MLDASPTWFDGQFDMNYLGDTGSHKRQRIDQGINAVTTEPYINSFIASADAGYDPIRNTLLSTNGEAFLSSQRDASFVGTPWESLPSTQTSLSTHPPYLGDGIASLQFDFTDSFPSENLVWNDESAIRTLAGKQTIQGSQTDVVNCGNTPVDESICCFGMVSNCCGR